METENNRRKNLEHHRGRKNRGNGNAASGGEKELKIGKSSALGTMSGNKGSGGSGGGGGRTVTYQERKETGQQ